MSALMGIAVPALLSAAAVGLMVPADPRPAPLPDLATRADMIRADMIRARMQADGAPLTTAGAAPTVTGTSL